MEKITPVKFPFIKQLKTDRPYRAKFFSGQTADEIAMELRGLRDRRRMRQADLAEKAGMKQSAISRIEQAKYSAWSINTLLKAAEALDARLSVRFEPAEDVIAFYENAEKNAEVEDTFNLYPAIEEKTPKSYPLIWESSQSFEIGLRGLLETHDARTFQPERVRKLEGVPMKAKTKAKSPDLTKREAEKVKSDGFVNIYCNSAQVELSPWDIKLKFGRVEESTLTTLKINELAHVYMSPTHTKAFLKILIGAVQKYEDNIGPIKDIAIE